MNLISKMNRKTLNKRCQKLYQNILTAIESDDKLRNHSDAFSIILERSINDFETSLIDCVDIESECTIDVNLLNTPFESTSNENKINMGKLASIFSEEDVANDPIELNDNLSFLNLTFEMDIQEEVVVTTSTKGDDRLESNKVDDIETEERTRKVKHGTHSHMKRRRTMDEDSIRTATGGSVFKSPLSKRLKNRHSNLRKTIASRSELSHLIENVGAKEQNKSKPKNIISEMYAKNDLYRTLCVLCNQNERYLVAHYAKKHPKYEVLISRPSPKMAKKLRLQSEIFEMQNKKIKGICFFCEEKKNMAKFNWFTHILSHTGESIYFCSICNLSMKSKRDHKNCNTEPCNIYDANTNDGSLKAFMCSKCNYLQVGRERIVRHLIKEHGYDEVEESIQFEKVQLVPDLSPPDADIPVEYGFSVRFKCTICSVYSKNIEQFESHINEAHKYIGNYKCLCGEKIKIDEGSSLDDSIHTRIDDSICPAKAISSHLAHHNLDLYRCMVCKDIFLTQRNIQDHLLNEHTEQQFKYQHIHRESDKKLSIAETMITKIKCHICGEELRDGNFAQAITHFNSKHDGQNVHIAGFISRKFSHQNKIEIKHYAYVISFDY